MADSTTVQSGLAALTPAGWDVIEPNEGGRFGSVGVLTAAQVAALAAAPLAQAASTLAVLNASRNALRDPAGGADIALGGGSGSITPRQNVPGLPTLPMTLLFAGASPGLAIASNNGNAIQAARIANASITNTGILYLKPSTGSDANAGTSATAPLATIGAAMRTKSTAASRVVCLEDCVLPSFDLRSTDASQTTQQFKWLDGNGYNVIIRDSGTDLTAVVWMIDVTFTNCYKVDLSAAGLSAGQTVTRVLRSDILDKYGYTRQFRKYASASALNTPGANEPNGFFWDNAGRVLWLNMNSTSVEARKAVLKGLYTTTAATSRIFCYGSSLGLRGVRLEGVQILHLDQGGRRPQIWLEKCQQLWAYSKGADLTQAGDYVSTNSLVYASESDGVNAFAKGATGKGLILTVNSKFIRCGDQSVFDPDGTKQGISAHGGSHHVSWGSEFIENNGQGVADTCAANETGDISWLVNCRVKADGQYSGAFASYLFGSVATSSSRTAYLDSCESELSPGPDIWQDVNATVYTYNTTAAIITGSVSPYVPVF